MPGALLSLSSAEPGMRSDAGIDVGGYWLARSRQQYAHSRD
jgi:hypothetical protein